MEPEGIVWITLTTVMPQKKEGSTDQQTDSGLPIHVIQVYVPVNNNAKVHSCHPSWNAMVRSRLTAISTSRVQAILLPQPPEVKGWSPSGIHLHFPLNAASSSTHSPSSQGCAPSPCPGCGRCEEKNHIMEVFEETHVRTLRRKQRMDGECGQVCAMSFLVTLPTFSPELLSEMALEGRFSNQGVQTAVINVFKGGGLQSNELYALNENISHTVLEKARGWRQAFTSETWNITEDVKYLPGIDVTWMSQLE
ncbi:Proline-rich protein 5-like [Plecturocebus cupreus]